MSALDEVVIDGRRTAKHYRTAQIELAQLRAERDEARADNARLTTENASLLESFKSEYERAEKISRHEIWYNAEIERLHAALDSQLTTLTPRNCETCKRAAEAMREAAASKLLEIAQRSKQEWIRTSGGKDSSSQYLKDYNCEYAMYEIVCNIPLPSFGAEQCAGCAPLKPE